MRRQALPRIDLGSILLYILFILLGVLVLMFMLMKFRDDMLAHAKETLYEHPTWSSETEISTKERDYHETRGG